MPTPPGATTDEMQRLQKVLPSSHPRGGIGAVSAGISEALFTTAVGLCVAIPAVMMFNYFSTVIDRFLVDINGHRRDPQVAAALERIRVKTGLFKVFGSYPRWRGKG